MPTKNSRGNKKRSSKRAPSAKAAAAASETASAESTPASAPAEAAGVAFGDKAKFIRRFPRNAKAKWLMAEYLKETGQTMSENHVYNIHKEMKAEEKAAGKTTAKKIAAKKTASKKTAAETGRAAKKVAATKTTSSRNLSVVRSNGANEPNDERQKYGEMFDRGVLGIGIVEAEARLARLKRGPSGVKTA